MIPLLFESPLFRAAGFRHGFTSRVVDFRHGREVAKEAVSLALRFSPADLHQVEQVHGDAVAIADGRDLQGIKADALIATKPGIAVGVRVADCVPILVADPDSGRVAAIHAGWRGVHSEIVRKTLEIMRERSMKPRIATIGPCIGVCCFEVGPEVAEKFTFVEHRNRDYVDLRREVRAQLERNGIDAIDDVPGCTRCDEENFFSHRRDGEHSGRHLGVISSRA